MYENSKHANWLLVTLLATLLFSSLILGWLLTRSSVFANPHLLTTAQLAEKNLTIAVPATMPKAEPIQVPPAKTEKQTAVLETPTISAKPMPKQNVATQTANPSLPLNLLDSQDYLEQAAIIPQAILPLASLAANQPTALPKTTAPTALTLQGLVNPPTDLVLTTSSKPKSAWLYAGQFQNGKWSLLGLDLDVTAMPEPHHSYKLTWGAKVRSAPPGQRMNTSSDNLAESIGYLAEGSSIQVLNVKQSGKNGHIWLEIAYGE